MKKLNRSKQDSKIAGVCGGLGIYNEIDSVIFRILFVVLLFCGGIGLLVYLVMWILIPLDSSDQIQNQTALQRKRLYLSDTDRKIFGVCGGLGEFFNRDPVLFRILFVVLVFLGGVGLLLYLIFCFILPRRK